MPYARKPRYRRKSVKPVSFAKRVRKVISSTAQTKHATNSLYYPSINNDDIHVLSPTQNIAPGTAINQRIGDQVKLKSLNINGFFSAATLANANVKFRVSVFYCPEGKSASSGTTGAFTAAELFQPNTATTPSYAQFDEKAVTVLADMTMDLNSNISTSQEVKSFVINIPLKNVKCNYKEAGSAFAMKKNIYIMVTGYTPVALNVGDLGQLFYSYDLEFTDI